MTEQKDFKDLGDIDSMNQTKFYFYNLFTRVKEKKIFNWETALDKIKEESDKKQPVYKKHTDYLLSIHISKKDNTGDEKIYSGYFVVGENKGEYKKEKKGEFFELGFDEDEHLCHTPKGKLYFLIWLNKKGDIILMLERQYFSLNIRGFAHYFEERYKELIENIDSKNIIGKDLKSTLQTLKSNEIKCVRIYFRKYAPEDRIKKFGYVEDVIPNLLKKGIYADLILRWEKPIKTDGFFKKFFKKDTFEEALDIDFGELLKTFSFDTDNDTIPSMNLLDKIIFFQLPRDKSEYTDEEIFKVMKEGFGNKKEKLL